MAMVERDDDGWLHVPPESLSGFEPRAAFEIETSADSVTLHAVGRGRAAWDRSTPAQRAEAIRKWADSCPPVPPLPDEAFQRENWYD